MITHTITLELSPEGCAQAVKDLEAFKQRIATGAETLALNLAKRGEDVAKKQLATLQPAEPPFTIPDPGSVEFSVNAITEGSSKKYQLLASSEVGNLDVLFLEFGTGVHFNGPAHQSPHPQGKEFNYLIGEYGQGFGQNDFWYYDGGKSQGNEAVMFMQAAADMLEDMKIVMEEADKAFR